MQTHDSPSICVLGPCLAQTRYNEDAPPTHPYVEGEDRDLCVNCLVKILQKKPAELPTPDAATAAGGQ